MAIKGATSKNCTEVNGFFFNQGMRDDKPFFKNLVSQSYLYFASNGFWYVSSKDDFDAGKAAGWCRSAEPGLDHPSRARLWKGWKTKWVDQPAIEVNTVVQPFSGKRGEQFSLN